MPIYFADPSIDPIALKNVPERFIIFYSSVVDGQMWCPDCRAIDPLIQETFAAPESPPALIVYVGNRQQWKTPSNIYRQTPWNVTGVPTIIRLNNYMNQGEPADRLVEDEIQPLLAQFVTKDADA